MGRFRDLAKKENSANHCKEGLKEVFVLFCFPYMDLAIPVYPSHFGHLSCPLIFFYSPFPHFIQAPSVSEEGKQL